MYDERKTLNHDMKTNGILVVAIVSISFAATFIRLAAAPPIVIAGYRMLLTTLVLLPFALLSSRTRGELSRLGYGDIGLLALSGLFLALHFISWIASIFLTGVASSIVLVTMTPLFVALYSIFVLDERVPTVFWIGLLLAAVGALVIGGGDLFHGGMRWRGDALALLGAIAAAGYFIVGSRLRKKMSLIGYVFPVYLAATVCILTVAVMWKIPLTGYGGNVYLYSLLLALVCQIMGHTLFNWALAHVKATFVTFGTLGEPVGASLIAFIILDEIPRATELLGGLFIIAGLFCALYFGKGRRVV